MVKPWQGVVGAGWDITDPELRIEPVRWGSHGRVAVVGELDLGNVCEAEAALTVLADDGALRVLDVTGLTFCTSQGVAMLFRLARRLNAEGGSLTIANPCDGVRRVLEITRVNAAATIIDDA